MNHATSTVSTHLRDHVPEIANGPVPGRNGAICDHPTDDGYAFSASFHFTAEPVLSSDRS